MRLTPEFKNAVSTRNLLLIRIMLKDSLLIDKQLYLFNEMKKYAERQGVDFWMKKTEDIEVLPCDEWNIDLMNLELTRLVENFTEERLIYCQRIIEKIYGNIPYDDKSSIKQKSLDQSTRAQPSCRNNQRVQKNFLRDVSINGNDYKNIFVHVHCINRILKNNKSPNGDMSWKYSDIDKILHSAEMIIAACKNINSRRNKL